MSQHRQRARNSRKVAVAIAAAAASAAFSPLARAGFSSINTVDINVSGGTSDSVATGVMGGQTVGYATELPLNNQIAFLAAAGDPINHFWNLVPAGYQRGVANATNGMHQVGEVV